MNAHLNNVHSKGWGCREQLHDSLLKRTGIVFIIWKQKCLFYLVQKPWTNLVVYIWEQHECK